VNKDELLQRFQHLINGQTLWSGCLAMMFINSIYKENDFNLFDREQLMKMILIEWAKAHEDILIPPNPENKAFAIVSLDHPVDRHVFTDDVENAILAYAELTKKGYPSRIIDTRTGEALTH
jgi:hypothetical protein